MVELRLLVVGEIFDRRMVVRKRSCRVGVVS
jgi:hypothetical protein